MGRKLDDLNKNIGELNELMKKSVGKNFVEEEPVIDVRFVNETRYIKMKVDTGAPYSIASTK